MEHWVKYDPWRTSVVDDSTSTSSNCVVYFFTLCTLALYSVYAANEYLTAPPLEIQKSVNQT